MAHHRRIPNNGDLNSVFPPETALQNSYTYDGKTYETNETIGAGIYLRHVWGTLVPGFYKDPKENHTAYAWTWVYSPKDQEAGAWIEFQNYGPFGNGPGATAGQVGLQR